MSNGHPRLVNQRLINQMAALRRKGFSHGEIAEKVERSERTVRRYTKGVTPQLEIPTQPEPVDVLSACARLILAWRGQLHLDTRETDRVIKALRKQLEGIDPLTMKWLGTDRQARRDFLVEFLRPTLRHINEVRQIQRIEAEIGVFE